MTWRRVTALEWRRTGGPLVALGLLVVGAVLFAAKQRPFYLYPDWSSTWSNAVTFLNQTNIVVGPVVATVAAWSAGRERRRRMDELLTSTARPSWQRRLTTLVAVTVGLVVGWLLQAAVVLGAVFPTVSYFGGRWTAAVGLNVLGIVVCIALGFAVGRRVPGRLVPPLLGLAVYVGFGILTYVSGLASIQLVPIAALNIFEGQQLKPWAIPFAITWFAAVACGLAVLGVGRRRHWPVGVASTVVATASAVVLTTVIGAAPGPDGAAGDVSRSWIEQDPAAAVQVCTDDAPVVCVQKIHANLLADVTPVARRQLAALNRYGTYRRAEELPYLTAAGDEVMVLASLRGLARPYRGGWDETSAEQWVSDTVYRATSPACEFAVDLPPWWFVVTTAATALVDPAAPRADPAADALLQRLKADPAAAEQWLRAYLPAARSCERATLERLAGG